MPRKVQLLSDIVRVVTKRPHFKHHIVFVATCTTGGNSRKDICTPLETYVNELQQCRNRFSHNQSNVLIAGHGCRTKTNFRLPTDTVIIMYCGHHDQIDDGKLALSSHEEFNLFVALQQGFGCDLYNLLRLLRRSCEGDHTCFSVYDSIVPDLEISMNIDGRFRSSIFFNPTDESEYLFERIYVMTHQSKHTGEEIRAGTKKWIHLMETPWHKKLTRLDYQILHGMTTRLQCNTEDIINDGHQHRQEEKQADKAMQNDHVRQSFKRVIITSSMIVPNPELVFPIHLIHKVPWNTRKTPNRQYKRRRRR